MHKWPRAVDSENSPRKCVQTKTTFRSVCNLFRYREISSHCMLQSDVSALSSSTPSPRCLVQCKCWDREHQSRQDIQQHDSHSVMQRRRCATEWVTRWTAQPVGCGKYVKPLAEQSFGSMTVKCVYCHTFHWLDERVKNSSKSHSEFAHCCYYGKVSLPKLPTSWTTLKIVLQWRQQCEAFPTT